jgi:uncharacterized DUF497 family protein
MVEWNLDIEISWDESKSNEILKARGICFDDVIEAIRLGRVLDDIAHPNQERYGHQRLLIVEIGGYACSVPYVFEGDARFLKTMFRNRVQHKRYLGET